MHAWHAYSVNDKTVTQSVASYCDSEMNCYCYEQCIMKKIPVYTRTRSDNGEFVALSNFAKLLSMCQLAKEAGFVVEVTQDRVKRGGGGERARSFQGKNMWIHCAINYLIAPQSKWVPARYRVKVHYITHHFATSDIGYQRTSDQAESRQEGKTNVFVTF